jgi:hypothetical protein
MKTLYIKFKVVGVSYFDTPPDATLRLNGFDTGMRAFAGRAEPSLPEPLLPEPLPYAEYEIADATFDGNAVMQPVPHTCTDERGYAHMVDDDVWVARPVPDNFAIPDIRTARIRRALYEDALERLSREIRGARRVAEVV